MFETRRLVTITNYTFTKSKIKVGASDIVNVFGTTPQPATNFFRDGAPLTGQSDHLVNLQLGLEDTGGLSQQTFLLTYASKRVTSRGSAGQPDIIEYPGFRLDFVAREGVKIAGVETEIKFEVRNITNTKYQEYQRVGANRNYYNLYNLGTTATLGASVTF
jgi:outer membrane receptor protein involved in Fe transport